MAISFFDAVSTPADNNSNTTTPVVISPPSNMQAGDLCVVFVTYGTTSGTVAVSQAGGQSWTSLTQRNASGCRTRGFWCVFDGTWDADPSFSGRSGTYGLTAAMMIFRPTGGTLSTWVVDGAESSGTFSAPSSPYLITHNGITTSYNGTLVVCFMACAAANTWSGLGGSTHSWTNLDDTQYRNTGATANSITAAYMIDTAAGATGTCYKNESAGNAGAYLMIGFREIEQHSGAAATSGKGLVTALGAMAIGALAAVSAGPGHVAVTGEAAWSANPIVKVINETLQRPTYDLSGIAAISGNGAVAASGAKGGLAAAAETGSGAVAVTGHKLASGAEAVSGNGAVVVAGAKTGAGASAVSGNGSVAASGSSGTGGASAVSGNGSVVASGVMGGQSAPSVSAAGAVSGLGSKGGAGGAVVSGQGAVAATGEKQETVNAIVKVINETLQRPSDAYSGASAVTGNGSVAASGNKQGRVAAAISGNGSVVATGTSFIANPIVKVINETLQRPLLGQVASSVSGGGAVVSTGAKSVSGPAAVSGAGAVVAEGSAPRFLVKVINESTANAEGSFLQTSEIVQVINESQSLPESVIKLPAKGDVVVSGSGSCATQGRKGGFGATQISASGSIETTPLPHARPAVVSGSGSVVASWSGQHYGTARVSARGRVAATSAVKTSGKYQKSFTRIRTGDPRTDRAFQLIEEEFSKMLDYINRKTG